MPVLTTAYTLAITVSMPQLELSTKSCLEQLAEAAEGQHS